MAISYSQIIKRVNNPDGKERIIKDSLHYGVGNYAYTYSKDAEKAELIINENFIVHEWNPTFVKLTEKGIIKFCKWLNDQPESF
jgi:hypothetical protein